MTNSLLKNEEESNGKTLSIDFLLLHAKTWEKTITNIHTKINEMVFKSISKNEILLDKFLLMKLQLNILLIG